MFILLSPLFWLKLREEMRIEEERNRGSIQLSKLLGWISCFFRAVGCLRLNVIQNVLCQIYLWHRKNLWSPSHHRFAYFIFCMLIPKIYKKKYA